MNYMIAIERGFRAYQTDKFAMGDKPLRSRERWVNIPIWRKAEAYITLIRHIRNHINYPKWHDYTYADLNERNLLHETYMQRHAHIWDSCDDPFKGHLEAPWDKDDENDSSDSDPPPKKKSRRKTHPRTKVKVEKKQKAASPSRPLMKFDRATGSFSAYVDLTN